MFTVFLSFTVPLIGNYVSPKLTPKLNDSLFVCFLHSVLTFFLQTLRVIDPIRLDTHQVIFTFRSCCIGVIFEMQKHNNFLINLLYFFPKLMKIRNTDQFKF